MSRFFTGILVVAVPPPALPPTPLPVLPLVPLILRCPWLLCSIMLYMLRVWDHNLTVPLRPRCLEAVLVASTSSEVDCIEGGKNQSGIFILTLIYHVHICNVLVVRGGTLLHGKTL